MIGSVPMANIKTEFQKELEQLINTHSMETYTDTPDFVLAKYLNNCLIAFNQAMTERKEFFANPPYNPAAQ